jgi:hypothetical protein
MQNKNEFQPDKPKLGILDRLYLTRLQRKILLKWVLYSAVLLVLSLLQDVILCRFQLWGATTELIPCAVMLICLLEGLESGCIFTLCASCLYLFSGTAPGVYAMVALTVLTIVAAWFRQAYLQRGFGSAILCVAVCMIVYELAVFGIGLFLGQTYGYRILAFLVTALGSVLAVPILYPVFLRIQAIGGEIWRE